jgi:RNA polymerase sigma-70 factor (ECF subfamily)
VPLRELAALAINSGDGQLVARLKRRDADAVAELSRRFSAVLFALILNIVGDSGTAEDLLTEVFLKASNLIQAMPQSDVALGLWMLALARNHAVNFLRSSGHAADTSEARAPLELPVLFDGHNLGNAQVDVEQMRRVFIEGGEHERLALELAWYEGLSFEELADRLGISAEAVRESVNSVLQRMRTAASS